MKKNIFYYVMMAANAVNDQALTPVECEMQKKFLQGDGSKAV